MSEQYTLMMNILMKVRAKIFFIAKWVITKKINAHHHSVPCNKSRNCLISVWHSKNNIDNVSPLWNISFHILSRVTIVTKIVYHDARCCSNLRTACCGGNGEQIQIDSRLYCNLCVRTYPCCCIPACFPKCCFPWMNRVSMMYDKCHKTVTLFCVYLRFILGWPLFSLLEIRTAWIFTDVGLCFSQ